MDATSETRLAAINPSLAALVRHLDNLLQPEGITIRVVQGLRLWADQYALWLKGRDAAGRVVDPTAIVTHAPPGHSWHQFGLAVDVAPFDDGIPDWNDAHPCWARMIEFGESIGLYSGSHFVGAPTPHFPLGKPETDNPHFQLTGKFPTSPTDEVRAIFRTGGMSAVWQAAALEEVT